MNKVRRKKAILEEVLHQEWYVDQISKISFDGKQHLVRIPTRVVEVMDIKKGDYFHFLIEFTKSKKPKKLIIEYEAVK